MKSRTKSSNPSKKLKKLEPQIEKNVEIPPKNTQEYLDARTIHDRFCKFEIPYNAGESIKTIRLISELIPVKYLKQIDLPFKLNSLRWFLTPKGKEFLQSQHKRCQLDEKLAELDLNKIILS